jgi:hypothetical protein
VKYSYSRPLISQVWVNDPGGEAGKKAGALYDLPWAMAGGFIPQKFCPDRGCRAKIADEDVLIRKKWLLSSLRMLIQELLMACFLSVLLRLLLQKKSSTSSFLQKKISIFPEEILRRTSISSVIMVSVFLLKK